MPDCLSTTRAAISGRPAETRVVMGRTAGGVTSFFHSFSR